MTTAGLCLSCGMRSLESGADLYGPFSKCQRCGWQDEAPGMSAGQAPVAVAGHADPGLQVEIARARAAAPAAAARTIRKPASGRMVVAISGQTGTGAREIGHRVARALGCDHFDRLVQERVARRLRATVEAVAARERRPASRWDRVQRFLEKAFAQGAFSGWAADPYYLPPSAELIPSPVDLERGPKTQAYEIDEREYVSALAAELRQIAAKGDSVIVHPAACAVLPGSPDLFRVGVFAPEITRINNLLARRGVIEVEAAHRELAERDRAQDALLARSARARPGDLSAFDLTLNTGVMTIEDAAELLLGAIRTRVERRRGDAVVSTAARRAGEAPRSVPAVTREAPPPDEASIATLAGIDIFQGLPESQVREIAALGTVVRMPDGAALASEESVAEAVYAVLDGQVELSADSEVGRITVRVAQAGEAFPLAAIIGTGRIITRAEAMTDLELWRVDRVTFQDYLKSRPELGLPVYDAAARIMADRYRHTLSRLTRATERALSRSRPRVSV